MQKAKNIAIWVLQILLGLAFTLSGFGKLRGPIWPARFAGWGYPGHFHRLIGVLEMLGGIALLAPPLAGYGAAGLMVIMVGAAATHTVHGEKQWISPVVLLVLLSVIATVRLKTRAT